MNEIELNLKKIGNIQGNKHISVGYMNIDGCRKIWIVFFVYHLRDYLEFILLIFEGKKKNNNHAKAMKRKGDESEKNNRPISAQKADASCSNTKPAPLM